MLRDALLWSMILFLGMGCSKDLQLANTPSDVLPEIRLRTCVEGLRVRDLIPKEEKKTESVRFDYSPAAMDSMGCDGVYYYATFSKPFYPILHRDPGASQYAKYYMMIVLDGKLYPLATKSERYRRQFLEREKMVLIKKFGDSLVKKLTPSILSGYRRIE